MIRLACAGLKRHSFRAEHSRETKDTRRDQGATGRKKRSFLQQRRRRCTDIVGPGGSLLLILQTDISRSYPVGLRRRAVIFRFTS